LEDGTRRYQEEKLRNMELRDQVFRDTGNQSSVQNEIAELQGRLDKEVSVIEQYRIQKQELSNQLDKAIREKELTQ
jgi:chromosome segregation ATPase